METKSCKGKAGQEFDRELLRLRLLDDSAVDAEISVWGELAAKLHASVLPGQAIAFYRLRLQVGAAKSLSTTEDSFFIVLQSPDGISSREDSLIKDASTIQQTPPTETATSYEGTADVSGPLRVVTVRALQLATEITSSLNEVAWQVDVAIWDFEVSESVDNLTNKQGRLWTRIILQDCSGESRLYAAEEALLAMTGCQDKKEFLELFSGDALPRHRVQCWVRRQLRDGYSNVHLLQAKPVFTLAAPQPGSTKMHLGLVRTP